MAEYLIQEESLITIADEIRDLVGTSDKMSPDAMATTLQNIPRQSAKTITPSASSQIVVNSGTYATGDIIVEGDANLVSENIPKGISIFGIEGNHDGSGRIDVEDGMVARTGSVYTNNTVEGIGDYAFYYNYKLTSVSFLAAKYINRSAFYNCYSLAYANFPAATTINDMAFYGCSSLASANFPVVNAIRSSAFYLCKSLTSANFPAATTISGYAFYGCFSLASANFPVATTIGIGAFMVCSNLASANFPAATTIGSSAFWGCSGLTSISFPAATTIGGQAFYNCSNLTEIYLTNSSVCTLNHSNVFSGTGIWSTKGSIYVPSSLVASYKTASQWSYFSNRIFSVP